MKAILMTDKGAPDVLQLAEIPEPEISHPEEVKIKIRAASVNPIDTKVRRNGGFYQQQPLYTVLGCDGSGVIVSVGDKVTVYKAGDEVWFCNGGLGKDLGNYAEYTVIDSRWIALKPENITFIEAAAMPLVLITAWGALFEKGNLQTGQTVLIHGGAGGVGHVAIQLAKLKGANVITTVNHLTKGFGADLVIDTVGPDVFKDSMAATAYYGRLITLLDPGELPFAEARMRNLLIGFELMLTPILKGLDKARDKHVAILEQCAKWVEQGELCVHISDVFSLKDVVVAHNKIELGHTKGKIVLEI
jgi:NADPH2:quinone reductase